MKTSIRTNRSAILAAAATLAVAALGFAGAAQARDNVNWSVGVGVPGAVVNVGNVGSVYPQPIYVQPQPVYVQPQPVFVQPAPRYYQPEPVYVQPPPLYYQPRPVFVRPAPVYLAPQPIYYERERRHGYHRRHDGGNYVQGNGYGQGYGEVYYQRDGRDGYRGDRHDGRR